MAYVDYDYYALEFGGTLIDSPERFKNSARKAEAYVDTITSGRITEVTMATDAVKNAVCAVCDQLASADGHAGIIRESNDGYSVDFESDDSMFLREMYKAAKLFLPSDLLYRGMVE